MLESEFINEVLAKAKACYKTIVLPEGEDLRVLQAAEYVVKNKIAKMIVLGDIEQIKKDCSDNNICLDGIELINPKTSDKLQGYANILFDLRKAKGMTEEAALATAQNANYFGTLMVKAGDADGMVSGANHSTADTVRPALQIIKSKSRTRGVSSFLISVSNETPYVLSDIGVVINPTAQELSGIALESALSAIKFGIKPDVAMLSFSTYGSAKDESIDKVVEASRLANEALSQEEFVGLGVNIDGDLQVDAALDMNVGNKKAPNSSVAGKARVLVFPDLNAGNIGYKLLQRLGGCESYGPVLQGLNAPVNDLSRGCFYQEIIGVIAITALQAV